MMTRRVSSARLAITILLVAAGCGREKSAVPPAPAKQAAATSTAMEPYKAQWLDGSPFDLANEKGSVVLLNVWATWCGPCRFEIPELDKLHSKYAGRGFKVIGVSIDSSAASEVKAFVDEEKIGYPIAIDPEGKIATLLQTSVIPTSILLDKTGRIIWKHFGVVSTSDAELTQALESALAR